MIVKIYGEGWDETDFRLRFQPVIDRMVEDRGWVLNSYAQLEYLIADLYVKAAQLPFYIHKNPARISLGLESRANDLLELSQTGPLAFELPILTRIYTYLKGVENTRHFFAHGFASIHIAKDGSGVVMHYRRFVPPRKGGSVTVSELLVTPSESHLYREKCVRSSHWAVSELRRIYELLDLEKYSFEQEAPSRLDVSEAR